jgi:outer membrane receptor for monomeric catechols
LRILAVSSGQPEIKLAGNEVSHVAYNNNLIVDDYFAVDANILWNIQENLELMLAGQNLFDHGHLEFINEYFTPSTEIERSVYAKLTWKF